MTCIVGIIDKGDVYIGGDSAGVGGYEVIHRKDPKVFKVGDFVIGCTSSFRMIQLLRFSFSPPKHHEDEDVYRYMCTGFVDALRACFRNGGFMTVDRSAETGGVFLVGFKGRLFRIDEDFQVGESFDSFASVGCGEAYALGSLLAMSATEIPPMNQINSALSVAAYFSAGVRAPFVIESTCGISQYPEPPTERAHVEWLLKAHSNQLNHAPNGQRPD